MSKAVPLSTIGRTQPPSAARSANAAAGSSAASAPLRRAPRQSNCRAAGSMPCVLRGLAARGTSGRGIPLMRSKASLMLRSAPPGPRFARPEDNSGRVSKHAPPRWSAVFAASANFLRASNAAAASWRRPDRHRRRGAALGRASRRAPADPAAIAARLDAVGFLLDRAGLAAAARARLRRCPTSKGLDAIEPRARRPARSGGGSASICRRLAVSPRDWRSARREFESAPVRRIDLHDRSRRHPPRRLEMRRPALPGEADIIDGRPRRGDFRPSEGAAAE